MTRQEAKALVEKYNQGLATPEERARLERWYHEEQAAQRLSEDEADFLFLKDAIWQGTLQRAGLHQPDSRMKRIRYWSRIGAVAAVLLITLSGTWYFLGDRLFDGRSGIAGAHDIMPGGNRATLKVAGGQSYQLDTAQTGILMDGENIRYADSQPIEGLILQTDNFNDVALPLELATPVGGTYRVTLPDGTGVWLNAASTLTYPSRFDGDERVVELTGEGYFAVAKDRNRPFRVRSRGQEIEVLGTEFNIAAYADEPDIRTTLVEGKVKVKAIGNTLDQSPTTDHRSPVILSPGQQSVVRDGEATVREADVDGAIAWKSGMFRFSEEPLESIMRKVARWYDVDVEFTEPSLRNESFEGIVTRHDRVSAVLRMLERVGSVRFEIRDRRIIVLPKE
ncbi:FecR family protein [Parapedobacter sp. DT-150]|uniref:FecR family protein n=1 Tax=Parapedobacter sp. DT-150 TaxID=3396162 RepID=UPI003F1BAC35